MVTYPIKMTEEEHKVIKELSEDTDISMKALFIEGAKEYGKNVKKCIDEMLEG